MGCAGPPLSLSGVSEAARPSPQVPRVPPGPARGGPGLQRPRPGPARAGPVDRLVRGAAARPPGPGGQQQPVPHPAVGPDPEPRLPGAGPHPGPPPAEIGPRGSGRSCGWWRPSWIPPASAARATGRPTGTPSARRSGQRQTGPRLRVPRRHQGGLRVCPSPTLPAPPRVHPTSVLAPLTVLHPRWRKRRTSR